MSEVTRILSQIEQGDRQAAEKLLPLVYSELRKLAAAKLTRERPGQTLQATALVHEAYLRLVGPANANGFDNRGHFFTAAAEAMRRILVEQARRKSRTKHGGGHVRVDLEIIPIACDVADDDLLALHEALARFSEEDPLKAKLVELRYFVGMTNEEAAEVLGVSPVTAKRYWRYARARLHQIVGGQAVARESASENLDKS